jgi:hypothetical protein
MKIPIRIFFGVFIFTASLLLAQNSEDYTKYPGYFDFGNISFNGDNVTEVNIDYHLLSMLTEHSEDNKDDLSQLVRGLKLIKVYSFGVKQEDRKELLGKIVEMDKNLTTKNWDRIVKVKDPDEFTFVYTKPSGNSKTISGLVAVNYERTGKATFVNIVGELNKSDISKISNKFNLPSLDGKNNRKNK